MTPSACPDGKYAKKVAEKATLYFETGAQEFWLCDADGKMRFFILEGEIARSRLRPTFPGTIAG